MESNQELYMYHGFAITIIFALLVSVPIGVALGIGAGVIRGIYNFKDICVTDLRSIAATWIGVLFAGLVVLATC